MALNAYLNRKVSVMTIDGRTMVGTLLSCDNSMNLVLQDAIERVIRPVDDEQPSHLSSLGVFVIRGDNVAICGRVDEELDASIQWDKVHGEIIGTTKHT